MIPARQLQLDLLLSWVGRNPLLRSIWFCRMQTSELDGQWGGKPPISLRFLRVALISTILPRIQYGFCFTTFEARMRIQRFPLGLPTMLAPRLRCGNRSNYHVCPAQIYSQESEKWLQGRSLGFSGATVKQSLARTPSTTWPPYVPALTAWPWWCFCC